MRGGSADFEPDGPRQPQDTWRCPPRLQAHTRLVAFVEFVEFVVFVEFCFGGRLGSTLEPDGPRRLQNTLPLPPALASPHEPCRLRLLCHVCRICLILLWGGGSAAPSNPTDHDTLRTSWRYPPRLQARTKAVAFVAFVEFVEFVEFCSAGLLDRPRTRRATTRSGQPGVTPCACTPTQGLSPSSPSSCLSNLSNSALGGNSAALSNQTVTSPGMVTNPGLVTNPRAVANPEAVTNPGK